MLIELTNSNGLRLGLNLAHVEVWVELVGGSGVQVNFVSGRQETFAGADREKFLRAWRSYTSTTAAAEHGRDRG